MAEEIARRRKVEGVVLRRTAGERYAEREGEDE